MIYTITIILSILIGLNFLLLKFSCNKTIKSEKVSKPKALTVKTKNIITNQQVSNQLAATGS